MSTDSSVETRAVARFLLVGGQAGGNVKFINKNFTAKY